MPKIIRCAALVTTLLFWASPWALPLHGGEKAFLILAPDRGFLGNAEVQDAFENYKKPFQSELAFVDEEKTQEFLDQALNQVKRRGAGEVVILPLFLSAHDPRLKKAVRILSQRNASSISLAPPLAGHYLISEILSDRIATLSQGPSRESLLLVAQGASNEEEASAMEKDLLKAVEPLLDLYPFSEFGTVVLENETPLRDYRASSWERLKTRLTSARSKGLRPVLIPFDLGPKLDSTMSLAADLTRLARDFNALYDGKDLTPHDNLSLWLAQESKRRLPIHEKNLGIVFLTHGASYAWNKTMIDAIEPLKSRYKIEPAFGMGDPLLIERAVKKLEKQEVRAIAVVRVYSLEKSFRDAVEYALGLKSRLTHTHSHGNHGMALTRIRSGSAFCTLGGLEDSPLFAEALLERALALSQNPKQETVFLLAHGSGNEQENDHWLRNLASLAQQVQNLARRRQVFFHDVRFATWREDWPDHLEISAKKIRLEIQKAAQEGRAIVIPARAGPGGPEKQLLKGIDYAYTGEGFAPHPKFAQWVESQIQDALKRCNEL